MAAKTKTVIALGCLATTIVALKVSVAQSGTGKSDSSGTPISYGIRSSHRIAMTKTPMSATPEEREHINSLSEQANQMEKQSHALLEAGDIVGAEQAIKQAIAFYELYRPELRAPLLPVATAQRQILDDIYLKEGRYQTALETYGVVGKYTHGEGAIMGPTLNLNVALAYCGLGDYQSARHYYSDKAITQYSFGGKPVDPADLPGADSPQALVASIHLARGIDSYFHEENADAASDFAAAGQITPNNPLLNYYWSDALIRLHHYSEAAAHAEIATKHGHGPLPEFAVNKVNLARSSIAFLSKHPDYYTQHPKEAPKPLK